MRRSLRLLALHPLFALAGCTTAPTGPVPDPLPETLAWARPAATSASFVGLETRENTGASLDALSFEPGVRVVRVVEGSPAAAAGFEPGDVVLAAGGHAIGDVETFAAVERGAVPGEPLVLEVQRGDTVFEIVVAPRGIAPDPARADVDPRVLYRVDPTRSRAGWVAARGGVVLAATAPDGPFERAGVPVGSVVTSIDGEPVIAAHELIRAFLAREPGDDVRVAFVAPGGEPREETVELYERGRTVTELSVPILVGYEAAADGSEVSFELLDLWILSLFSYERDGAERRYSILSLIRFSSGVGELTQ